MRQYFQQQLDAGATQLTYMVSIPLVGKMPNLIETTKLLSLPTMPFLEYIETKSMDGPVQIPVFGVEV